MYYPPLCIYLFTYLLLNSMGESQLVVGYVARKPRPQWSGELGIAEAGNWPRQLHRGSVSITLIPAVLVRVLLL